ncbi:MAG TPA: fibronectin type III domain-containing protein [Candidatus Saccharimonadales bacterium]|nr:fibronectin type III domain-containing protein [Candidatus Saccharimonadales bacterium]
MRFLSQIKANAAGFTLIEVLIIAPIVIIAISGFIALIITMVGDVLATRDRNLMTFEIRDSLDRIEQDTRLSTQFLTTTVNIEAPQGKNDDTTPFSNADSLILGTLTTERNPVDSNRELVFYAKQPNECNAPNNLKYYNRPFIGKVIYFIKNGSLWRRSSLPPYNTNNPANDNTVCDTPWQLNSCSPGYVSSRCQTNDAQLMTNVESFNVKYYETPESTTELTAANALNAGSIEVTLTGKKSIAGRSIAQSGSVRVNKLNNIDADLPIPNAPTVTGYAGNNSITFTWDAVPAATSYLVRYNVNGSATWTETTLHGSATSFTVPSVLYRNQSATIEVKAKNLTGTSPAGTAAAVIPPWLTCDLQAGWRDYENGYARAAFTKTTAEVAILKGLIRFGTATSGTTICTLPEGYRPDKRIPFITSSLNGSVSGTGRIDIWPTGEVKFISGSNGWISLDGIRFVTSNASYTWTSPVLQNGWSDYTGGVNDTYPHQTTLDNENRVHVRGVVAPGNTTAGTALFSFSSAYSRWNQFTYLPTAGPSGFNYNGFGGIIDARGNPGTWLSLQAMYYPNTATISWTDLDPTYMANGWTWINVANHAFPKFRKSSDGIVTLNGLVKNANLSSDGTTIATLPPGFRPKEQLLTSCVAWGGYCRVDIMPDGRIIDNASANNGWVSLDNISFIAEQ